MSSSLVDVLILGGGPAGLSAASGIARQLHTAVVFNSSRHRNACTNHLHNMPGFDHLRPSAFLNTVRWEMESRYPTIQFKDTEVYKVSRQDNGTFVALNTNGEEFLGKTVILATGVRDIMPEIPGFAGLWETGIFHCISCHGYEARGHPSSAILISSGQQASPMSALPVCRMLGRFSDSVRIYTNGNKAFGDALSSQLKHSSRFHFDHRKVTGFSKDSSIDGDAGVLVTLEDGTVHKEGFVVHTPELEQSSEVVTQLLLEQTSEGYIKVVAPFNATNVPGVFAAGDCATVLK